MDNTFHRASRTKTQLYGFALITIIFMILLIVFNVQIQAWDDGDSLRKASGYEALPIVDQPFSIQPVPVPTPPAQAGQPQETLVPARSASLAADELALVALPVPTP